MLTLTRQGLLLSLSATVIPSQGSSDVPVAVVNDINTYVGYTLEPRVGYYLNGIYKSTVCTYDTSAKTFSVPAEAFKQIGIIDITLALIDNTNANHIETCQTVHATVNKAPLGTVVLPDQTTWQDYVNSYMNQLFDSNYKPQFDQIQQDLENLVTEAQQQQQTAEQQQTQIDNAISVMGEYQIVSNDPVQIQFKQGDGTYGPTVDLGDGLASKSMVNAGYYQSIGSQYSGSTSDYGIEVEEIVGAYTQETTTGAQKLDLSNVTDRFDTTHELTDTGLTVTGMYYVSVTNIEVQPNTDMYLSYEKSGSGVNQVSIYKAGSIEASDRIYSSGGTGGTFNTGDNSQVDILFYSAYGSSSSSSTYNDVMLCEGTSAKPYEPYTGGAPSPSPDYPQEPQFVEISELKSSGKNMFDYQSIVDEATDAGFSTSAVLEEKKGRNCLKIDAFEKNFRELQFLKGRFKENTQYKFSFTGFYSGSGNGLVIQAFYIDGTIKYITLNTPGAFQKKEMTTDQNRTVKGISFSFGFVDKGWIDLDSSYIVELSEDTGEFPGRFVGDIVALDEPLILRALPNGVADTWKNGTLTHNVASVTFDGSADENWSRYVADGVNQYSITLNNLALSTSGAVHVLSDKFKPINVNDRANNYNTVYNGASIIGINTDLDITTVKDWKTWLQSNPVTVWYELAEPTTEAFEIPRLQSFYPFTNAWCDSIVQPQITWNVLTGRSAILDGNGDIIQNGYMTPQDNLLINSDFRSGIINQKGQSSYNTQYQYGIDMWYQISTGTLTVNDDSISTSADLKQFFDRQPEDGDYTVAISVDGTLYNYTFEGFTGTSKTHNFTVDGKTLGVEMLTKQIILYMNGNTFNIDFVKLEKGKHFTGMPVWNYPTEFLKCAYRYINFYGQSIRRTAFIGNAMAYITYELPTIMAENITCIIKKDTTMLWQNDDTQSPVSTPITSATVIAKQGNAVTVQFNGSFGNENWRVAFCSGVGIELDTYDY